MAVDLFPIAITAQQWWWHIEYPNEDGSLIVSTANELHIPAGKRIRLPLQAVDVIPSLGVLRLAGKRDLIPGSGAELLARKNRPGVYRD